jgi:antitoxin PrlF
MPARSTLKRKYGSDEDVRTGTEYRGKLTRTGNSTGIRFERALFTSHPEFSGEVKARVIAPGRMLVTTEVEKQERTDPVMESFLAFLAHDTACAPEKIRPLEVRLMKRAERLTKGVSTNRDEDLGGTASL